MKKIMKIDKTTITGLMLLILVQFFPGVDLTHHLEASRLYHEMIAQGIVYLKSPYLLAGEQLTITYGSAYYLLAGLLWYVFERFTVDALIIISTLLSFLIIVKMTDSLRYRLIALLFISAMSIPDAYVACLANLFLWLAAYMFKKGKKYYQVPLIIGCLSHPFSIIVGLYYAYKDKRNIIIIVIAAAYFLAIATIFTSQGNIILPNIFLIALLGRAFIGLYPILLNQKLHQKVVSWSIALVAVGVIPCNAVQFLIIEPNQVHGFYDNYRSLFKNFPNIKGNMRAVDYNYLPSAYYFHQKGLTINTGSFFESWVHNTRRDWKSVEEYERNLKDNNISHILICKKCGTGSLAPVQKQAFLVGDPGVNPLEKKVLAERHKLIWENEYYKLYFRER